MLIRTSIDGPLFYEFIFILSFVPRLVYPLGFMLSPLGNEAMISCHVVFFCVICYNPVRQIKMTTTAPPGHVHEDFSTVIDDVKPALVDKRKLVLHYIGRSLRACLLVLLSSHCLVLSRPKHDSVGHTLSLFAHRWSQIQPDPLCREGEKVQRSRGLPRRRLLSTAGACRSACLVVLSQALLVREGLRPLLPRCRSVGRSGLPPPT